jgi:hypothetical protein
MIEMNTILPHLNTGYSVLLVIANIILYGITILFFINKYLLTNSETHINNNRYKDNHRAASNNPPTIISKPLGGYSREQLNEIYLLGILLHQIYYSVTGDNFTERLQRKALNIQMRFFITVFPQRNVNEYFDFTENFMSKNESLCNYSVTECIERSIGILSTCNDGQIRKLQCLYKALTTLYSEVGGGNKVALTTFYSMLDAELSSLTVEDDWRNHYAKKKTH